MKSKIIENDCLEILQDRRLVDSISGKRFIITGSNGLIGNYFVTLFDLANKLFNAGIIAHCISKHDPVRTNNTFFFITRDLSMPFEIPMKVDYIIHGATYPRPRIFLKNELETIALNIDATRTLLEMAKQNKAKLLFLSSSEIYGQPPIEDLPTREDYNRTFQTDNIRSAYVESKRMGEVLCHVYNRNFGVDAKIVRLSLIYGPGISIKDERAMGDFMRQALIDRHIKLIDKGQALRTYCYISDAIKMMLSILLWGKEIVYNVGGIESKFVYEVARMIADKCGATLELGDAEMLNAPSFVKMDISKVCKEFKIDNFVPLDEGINKMITWNKEQVYV